MGFIYNIANHMDGVFKANIKEIHTRDLLRALDNNTFKLAYAYSMQCYSMFQGTASIKADFNLTLSTLHTDLRSLGYSPTVNNSFDSSGNVVSSTLTLGMDLKSEWKQRAVKVVGYQGMNVLGFDTD